jgi:hypothetical protein
LLDVLAVCGASNDTRSLIRVWQTQPSDVDGCINMHSPRPLALRMTLGDASVPVLALVDAVEALGYRGEKCLATHSATSPKEFDSRQVITKRSYLQCILALPELLHAGVVSFQSGQSSVYYSLLLRTKKLPAAGLAAKEYKRLALAFTGDPIALRLLDRVAPSLPALQLANRIEPIYDDVAGDDEAEVDFAEPFAPLQDVAHPEVEIAGEAPAAPVLIAEVPREIMGQWVKRVKGRQGGGWSYHDRIAVSCSNTEHLHCNRSRSLVMDIDIFGPSAAQTFLSVWLGKADSLSEAAHKAYIPSRADVRAFLAVP